MEIIQLQPNKIKPDPNQPRKFFSEEKIEKLAKTIRTTGIINPIEVDKSYMIITGENRWRAAKLVGLKTVPVKILDISADDRFIRQLIENIHSANLKPLEIAKAYKKLLSNLAAKLDRDSKHQGERYQTGIKELAEKMGEDESNIVMYLDLLKQSDPLQKAVQDGLPVTHIASLNKLPKEHRAAMEKKLVKGEIKTRDASRYIVNAIVRTPDKAREILAKDYSKYNTSQEVAEAVAIISPRLSDMIGAGLKPADQLTKIYESFLDWTKKTSYRDIGKMYLPEVIITLSVMQDSISKWVKENNETRRN